MSAVALNVSGPSTQGLTKNLDAEGFEESLLLPERLKNNFTLLVLRHGV